MTGRVKVVAKITARGDKIAETRKLLLWLAEQSRAENGCTFYEVLENISAPNVFVLHEEWESMAALNAHGETSHVMEAFAQAGGLVAAAPDRGFYKAVG